MSEVTLDELVARAEALVPRLSESAAQADRDRMLSEETMRAIRECGLLRFFQPRRYGGYEMEWGAQIAIARALAKGCASASWVVCVVGSHAAYVGRMHPAAQDDVWGEGQDVLIATGSVARNVCIRGEGSGGYVVSGRWSFCSGIDHAQWALLRGIPEGDTRQHYFLVPRSAFTVVDDWYVVGMRGTGSKSISVEESFVPVHRTIPLTELMSPMPPGSRVNSSTVYSYNFRPFAGTALLGPIVGTAETALYTYISMSRSEGGSAPVFGNPGDPTFQLRLAESTAEIGAATELLQSLVRRQQLYASSGYEIPMAARIALVRDRTFTARLCFEAIERLVSHADHSAVLGDSLLYRQYRDLSAMVQQIGVNWDRNMTNCVKAMFEMETDIPYLNAT